MKKIITSLFTLLLAGTGLGVSAQELGEAQVVRPYGNSPYQTDMMVVSLSWGQEVSMVNPVNGGNGDYFVLTATFNGEKYEIGAFDNSNYGIAEPGVYFYVADITQSNWQTIPGTLTVEIPEGVVTAGGKTNAAQTLTYELLPPPIYMGTTPETYKTYPAEALNNVIIAFNSGEITLTDPVPPLYVIPTFGKPYELTGVVSTSGNNLALDLSNLPNNDYQIIVPSGTAVWTNANGNRTTNAELRLYYNISDGLSEAEILQPGENVTELLPLQLTWNYETIDESKSSKDGLYALLKVDGVDKSVKIPASAFSFFEAKKGETPVESTPGKGNVLQIDYAPYVPDNIDTGTGINISIPGGIIESSSGPNPDQEVKMTYYMLFPAQPTGVLAEDVVTFTWPGLVAMLSVNWNNTKPITLTGESNNFIEDLKYDEKADDSAPVSIVGKNVCINLGMLDLEYGNYTINIPAEYFYITYQGMIDYLNQATTYDFNYDETSGISFINQGVEVVKVYNLQGVKVFEGKDVDGMKNLPSGIYVINGKKVVIK